MKRSVVAHEGFMNASRTILPRVGGGVGGRGEVGTHPCLSSHQGRTRPVDNATASVARDRLGWMAAPRQIGGRS